MVHESALGGLLVCFEPLPYLTICIIFCGFCELVSGVATPAFGVVLCCAVMRFVPLRSGTSLVELCRWVFM